MQRMESHIASSIMAVACLCLAAGCSPLLMWDRDGSDLDVAKLNQQPPAAPEIDDEGPPRRSRSADESDPPPKPAEPSDEDSSTASETDSAEFLDQLRGTDDLTAEEQKTIERLMQKSPEAARFLADRAGDPAQHSLAKVHESTVAPAREGESSGIDLLREGTTLPPTRLDGGLSQAASPIEHPPEVRLGAPEPLREPSNDRMLPPPAAANPTPLPVVVHGNPAPRGTPVDGAPMNPAGQLQPLPAQYPVASPAPPPYGQHDPHSMGNPRQLQTTVQYGSPPYARPGYPHATRGYPQTSPAEVFYGHRTSPAGPRSGYHDPQMIINRHVQPQQPQAEGVARASFNASYPDTAAWGHAAGDPNPQPGAALEAVQPHDWRGHLESAIEALESELNAAHHGGGATGASGDGADEAALDASQPSTLTPLKRQELAQLDAQLRMLYLVAGMREAAVMPVEHYDTRQQEFWKYTMNGLSVYLDREKHPVDDRRLRLALRDLRHAVAELANGSTLDVRNLAFCSKVNSFGNYDEFDDYRFAAGQEVLLYVEVENFTSAKVSGGFETSLLGSYRVFDAQRTRQADHTFIEETEVCRNHRRDYFITYRMYMPKDISPGPYTLQLTVEDLNGNKAGQASIQFEIE